MGKTKIITVFNLLQITSSENVGDKVEELLVKLNNTLHASVTSARQELIEALESMNQTASAAENNTSAALDQMKVTWESHLYELKQQAQNANVSIDECLGQNERTLTNLTSVFELEDSKCLRGHELRIINQANNTYHRVSKIFSVYN